MNPCIIFALTRCFRKDVKHHVLPLNGKIQLKHLEIFVLIKTPKNEIHSEKNVRAESYCRVTNDPV